jgi:hypothetical protein
MSFNESEFPKETTQTSEICKLCWFGAPLRQLPAFTHYLEFWQRSSGVLRQDAGAGRGEHLGGSFAMRGDHWASWAPSMSVLHQVKSSGHAWRPV